ncbi:hypothetical protein [Paracoccus marcusii]|uniref:hypothetical protein n=1 Tax=Paracoccus marcusii TaxID=59779 RepID=UPI0024921283|nr:hypothetical protein [Paracoccus marcusii]
MPDHKPMLVPFEADTEFNIDNGPEGATILALYRQGSQQIIHVRETRAQILEARLMALDGTPRS